MIEEELRQEIDRMWDMIYELQEETNDIKKRIDEIGYLMEFFHKKDIKRYLKTNTIEIKG